MEEALEDVMPEEGEAHWCYAYDAGPCQVSDIDELLQCEECGCLGCENHMLWWRESGRWRCFLCTGVWRQGPRNWDGSPREMDGDMEDSEDGKGPGTTPSYANSENAPQYDSDGK